MKIKPCPFCGGKAELDAYECTTTISEPFYLARVFCTACFARGVGFERKITNLADVKALCESDAIEFWNRRAKDRRMVDADDLIALIKEEIRKKGKNFDTDAEHVINFIEAVARK